MKTQQQKFRFSTWGVTALFTLFSVTAILAQTPVQKNGKLSVCGTKLCNQYGNAIQLRGMSTHGIQWYGWGSCLTEASLNALANDWGADILRISMYIQEGGYETNPTAFTNQVKTLVNEATERGMYALIDFHQLDPGDPNYNTTRAKTFFTAMANEFKDYNNVIYDICNEPNGVGWNTIRNYAVQVIPAIRAIDSDAVVLVGTHGWSTFGVSGNGTLQDVVNNPLPYSNVMYTFHFYAASHGQAYLDMLNNASNVLPVFVTEFGSQTASGDGDNNFTRTQQYIDLMRTKKISWCNWNYSDDFRSGAVWNEGTCSGGPWTVSQLKPAGAWIRERMLSPADDFPGGTQACQPASASADDGNVPANVLDDNLNTRWSANGDGQWIQFCLATQQTVNGVAIAFYNGNVRTSAFDVLTSLDGATWSAAATGLNSNGTSLNQQNFTFGQRVAKYIRIVGHGNSVNAWNSYTEVDILTATTPACEPATASADDGNVAANVLDNNIATRWSASGDGQWIQLCLSATSTVSGVQIAFYNGNQRQSIFDVLVSTDAATWTPAATALQSSGTSLALETFSFTPVTARYVRIVGHGNTVNAWNSYTEVRLTTTALNITPSDLNTSADESGISSHPNPTDGQVTITYRVPQQERVTLSIHNTGSNQTINLVDKVHTAGTHQVTLDTRSFTPGVHIIKLTTAQKTTTHKLLKN